MTALTLYIDGSIDFVSGDAGIVGAGTTFTALIAGDLILGPDGKWYELDVILTDTSATLDRSYAGESVSAAVGGTDWVILKASKDRDSVRTATKQLTDITSLYRRVVNLTNSDQTVRLNKATAADRAGMILQKAGLDQFQNGIFEDDQFSIRYLLANTWTKALGVDPTTGGVSFYSQLLLGNTISPLQLTATTNNFAPNGIDQANILRVSTNGPVSLTGISSGVDGRALLLMNVGDNELDLENEGGTSSAGNRFKLTGNLTLPSNSSILLVYDGATGRWRQAAGAGGGSAGGDVDGDKGWSPILAYETNAGRIVAKISDWVGGEGAKPAVGAYIGATGLVDAVANAVNIQGPAGDSIQFRVNLPTKMIQWSYVNTLNWQDLISFDNITGPPATLEWNFSTDVTDADPGDGAVRFDSANFSSISHIYLDSKYRQGTDASAWIGTFDDSSSLPNRGTILMIDTLDQTKFATFQVTDAIVNGSGYYKIPVTPITGQIFTSGRRVSLIFLRTGDKGIPGIIPRGTWLNTTSYIVGDVVDRDGSSYISLIQPNIGNAPSFEATDAHWALFARGVNSEFVTAINQTLTDATAQAALATDRAAAALASELKAEAWATKDDGTPVENGIYSAKVYADQARADQILVHSMEENTETAAATAASASTSAAASAVVAGQQKDIAVTKATEASTSADAATAQAGIATTKAGDAATAKTDAQAAATSASSAKGGAETARDQAQGYATAAAGYAAALNNPDYGFWTEAPTDTRDYGSFS